MAVKKSGKFVIATSTCGSLDQAVLYPDGGATIYDSIESAKNDGNSALEDHESCYGEKAEKVYILQVVTEGEPHGVEWKK